MSYDWAWNLFFGVVYRRYYNEVDDVNMTILLLANLSAFHERQEDKNRPAMALARAALINRIPRTQRGCLCSPHIIV